MARALMVANLVQTDKIRLIDATTFKYLINPILAHHCELDVKITDEYVSNRDLTLDMSSNLRRFLLRCFANVPEQWLP